MVPVLLGLMLGGGLVMVSSCFVGVPEIKLRPPGWYERWIDMIIRSGIRHLTPWRHVVLTLVVMLVLAALVTAWSRTWAIGVVIALLAAGVPTMFIASRARARGAKMRAAWPDVIDSLISGVRAGSGLPEMISELAHIGPEVLRPQFVAFARDYSVDGRFDEALSRLKERCADPVADRIVEALRLARTVGGNDLSALLRSLSVLLREDARVRGELEARQSWTINAARLGVTAPWIVLILISSQAHAGEAYQHPEGIALLVGGATLSIVAYFLMCRLGRLSTDVRTLR